MLLPCNEILKNRTTCKLSRGNIQRHWDLPMGYSNMHDLRYRQQLISISKLILIYSKLEHQAKCIKSYRHHAILYTGLYDSQKFNCDDSHKSKKYETILNPFMIHPPVNKFISTTSIYELEILA